MKGSERQIPKNSVKIRYYRNLFTIDTPSNSPNITQPTPLAPATGSIDFPHLTRFMRGDAAKYGIDAERCIYCGKVPRGTRLTEEHVVSEALEARYIVRSASCFICQQATNHFETRILNDAFGAVNRRLQFLGKKREFRKSQYPVTIMSEGKEVKKNVHIDDHPTMIFLARLAPPGMFLRTAKE